jgi:hypothetical protein
MKKISIYFFALITSLGFLTSCGETETVNPAPSIVLDNTAPFIAANTEVTAGDSVKFKVVVTGNKINKFDATVSYDGGTPANLFTDANAGDKASYTKELAFKVRGVAGTETYTFTATDKNGEVTTKDIVITVKAAQTIRTQTAKLLGGQDNTTAGSFYATEGDGTVYMQADAKSNSAKVDFLYFYGATNQATIASPKDAGAQDIYDNSTSGIQTWSTTNDTKFKETTLTATDFNNATYASINTAAEGASATKSNLLVNGKVFAFVTAGGKRGLILVNTISGTQTGSIDITVKVQN